MVRRTKADAEATRDQLLDAAQTVFYEKGVAGASLAEVAKEAGLTRGAIYWHFEDKVDLFNALLRRTTLPFEQALQAAEIADSNCPALAVVLDAFRLVLYSVSTDEDTRRVFDIAIHKTECVGELLAVRERRMQEAQEFVMHMEHVLSQAAEQQQLELRMPVLSAARGLHAVFCCVLHAWLLYPQAPFALEEEGMLAVSCYLQGLGFRVDAIKNANFPKKGQSAG